MQKLKDIQHDFTHSLFQTDKIPVSDFIASDYASERLNIYRQTIIQNLRQALAITYPGIWHLLGDECADSVAYAYINNINNFPISGCLDDWGISFAEFLEQQPELITLPYLKDYAHYEWLKHLAYGQADSDYLTYDKLTTLSENELTNAIFYFHPTVYFMQSVFPLDNILNIIENPDSEKLHLTKQNTYALIARPENNVITYWLSEDYYVFFDDLKKGLSFGLSIEKAEKKYSDFNLSEIITFLIENKLISHISYA